VYAAPSHARSNGTLADSFHGYGLLGQTFASGDVLAFRRYDWSSIGPPFTTLWHRRPTGEWTFHTNVEPGRCSLRYLMAPDSAIRRDDIDVVWQGRREVSVHVHSARLRLALRLATTPATRTVGLFAGMLPGPVWLTRNGSRWIGNAAGRLLDAGPLTFAGDSPSGHRFVLRPHEMWRVTAAAAVLQGRELGEAVPLDDVVEIGGLRVPRAGLLFRGMTTFVADRQCTARAEPPAR
jgi:hypothetical protein